MGLLAGIDNDLKESIRNRENEKVSTLRMLKSDIMYEKTKGTEDLSDEKVLEIILRAAKKRKESIAEFTRAGRTDLAAKEESELKYIESYLPKQLGTEEIEAAIEAKFKELGEVSKKDFGKIMGVIMKELKGQADGNDVKMILTRKLEQL